MKANCLIAENLSGVLGKINAATAAAGRPPGSVDLTAVSKTQPTSAIEAAIGAGQKVFGENKVQEVTKKWPALKDKYRNTRLHFVGALQSNKARWPCAFAMLLKQSTAPNSPAHLPG